MVSKKTISYKSFSQLLSNIQDGNLSTTTLALICLNQVISSDVQCIQAIIDKKAIRLFLNILEADFLCVRRSQFAALHCLTKLCDCKILQKEVLSLNGLQLFFRCLDTTDLEFMFTAIRLISNISSDPSCWQFSHECGGVYQLIPLLNSYQNKMASYMQISKNDILLLKLSLAQYSAKSLSMLCQYEANRNVACSSDIIPVCHFWIKSKHQNVIIPILLLLRQLSIQVTFRKKVNNSRMILDILNHLQSTNIEVKKVASDLIFICTDDPEFFKVLQKQEFIVDIFQMLSNKSYNENEELMISLSGILWKCSKIEMCIKQLEKINAMPVLVQLLENPSFQVKAHIVGTIGMCLKRPLLREAIKKVGVIEMMMQYLQTTHIPLIINLNEALSEGSNDLEILNLFVQLDTIQLIWSCLKNSNFQVKCSAVWALCTILKRMKKANLTIQNSLDGIECVIDILTSRDKKILTPACSLIHNLAKDKSAVSVLVEFNVAAHLVRLMKTKDQKLLRQLCLAVASCCSTEKSCEKFIRCGVSEPLVRNLKTRNKALRVNAATALSKIAALSNWNVEDYQIKIIPVLIDLLTDPASKEGNTSSSVVLNSIFCINSNRIN